VGVFLAQPLPCFAGVTLIWCLLLGAATPWNRVRLTLGLGTIGNETAVFDPLFILMMVFLFFYPWSINASTGLGASISLEAASIMVASLGSAVILKREIMIDVLCQGSLFSVLLSLVAALILWDDSANNLYKPLHLIHACLI